MTTRINRRYWAFFSKALAQDCYTVRYNTTGLWYRSAYRMLASSEVHAFWRLRCSSTEEHLWAKDLFEVPTQCLRWGLNLYAPRYRPTARDGELPRGCLNSSCSTLTNWWCCSTVIGLLFTKRQFSESEKRTLSPTSSCLFSWSSSFQDPLQVLLNSNSTMLIWYTTSKYS